MGWCGQTDISENGTSLIFQWFGPNFLTLACFLQCKQKGVSNTNTSEKITYSKRRGLSWKHLQHAAFLPDGILGIGWYCVCWPTKSLWSFVSMHGHIYEETSHVSSCIHSQVPYRGTIVALDNGMDAFFVTTGIRTLFNILHSMMVFREKFLKHYTCRSSQQKYWPFSAGWFAVDADAVAL